MAQIIQDRTREHDLILNIRPEDIAITHQEGKEAEIYVIEHMGNQMLITLKLESLIIKVLTSPPFKHKMGEKVRLQFNLNKIHLFDKHTEKSLLLN
jgi:ABC-type sugar transport system ATPase subunit